MGRWSKYGTIDSVKEGDIVRLERDAAQTGGVYRIDRLRGQVQFGPEAALLQTVFFTELLREDLVTSMPKPDAVEEPLAPVDELEAITSELPPDSEEPAVSGDHIHF